MAGLATPFPSPQLVEFLPFLLDTPAEIETRVWVALKHAKSED